MSFEANIKPVGVLANADLSAKQYFFVDVNNTGRLVVLGAGAAGVGVLQDKPNAQDQMSEVAIAGMISKVVAGAALNAGDQLMADANGKAITATATNFVMGRALAAATGAGQIIPVLILGPYKI